MGEAITAIEFPWVENVIDRVPDKDAAYDQIDGPAWEASDPQYARSVGRARLAWQALGRACLGDTRAPTRTAESVGVRLHLLLGTWTRFEGWMSWAIDEMVEANRDRAVIVQVVAADPDSAEADQLRRWHSLPAESQGRLWTDAVEPWIARADGGTAEAMARTHALHNGSLWGGWDLGPTFETPRGRFADVQVARLLAELGRGRPFPWDEIGRTLQDAFAFPRIPSTYTRSQWATEFLALLRLHGSAAGPYRSLLDHPSNTEAQHAAAPPTHVDIYTAERVLEDMGEFTRFGWAGTSR